MTRNEAGLRLNRKQGKHSRAFSGAHAFHPSRGQFMRLYQGICTYPRTEYDIVY